MGLRDLRTDLKSLRYSGDTIGGGTSNQPYIKAKIPDGFNNLQDANSDFILRGGVLAARDSAVDVLRLGKMFIDTKSPSGILFIAKQNLLSRIAVRTQTSGRTLNEGVYTPLSTLAEAGLVAFGGHLKKQGINPFAGTGAYSNNNNLYEVRMRGYNNAGNFDESGLLLNRLVSLYTNKINNIPIGNVYVGANSIAPLSSNILSYPGGPGAPLGIGKTNIRFTDQRTGINNVKNSTGQFFGPLTWTPKQDTSLGIPTFGNFLLNQKGLVFNVYNNTTGSLAPLDSLDFIKTNTTPNQGGNVAFISNGTDVQTQEEINNSSELNSGRNSSWFAPSIQDFREVLRAKLKEKGPKYPNTNQPWTTVLSNAPDYNTKNLETRTNIGGLNGFGPGDRQGKTLISYTSGSGIGPVDKINALNLYSDTGVTANEVKNDLVKFRIAAINSTKPTLKTFMHFRAFIDNFSDSYNATWNPINYLGRGESFYTYNGFTRTISLGWTVAAQSKEELMPMYRKLNYLASNLAPDYTGKGYMVGNLVQLTIGGYLYEQVGFINSLTYDVPTESPWEIGINDEGDYDNTTKEMPHILKVTGFSFTPIHDFIPSKQGLVFTDNAGLKGNVTGFENQKYIALSTTEDIQGPDGYSTIDPTTNAIK